MSRLPLKFAAISLPVFAGTLFLTGCETAGGLGDDAIRLATYGRVQATPFADVQETKACRESLSQSLGFPRESRAMKNGVLVVQSYDCKADRIIATVSLTNRSSEPMFCFAETEDTVAGVHVAPGGISRFEYSYTESAYQNCEYTS